MLSYLIKYHTTLSVQYYQDYLELVIFENLILTAYMCEIELAYLC